MGEAFVEVDASSALFTELYDRLKAMARRHRRGRRQDTLCTTEVVHELFLRMDGSQFSRAPSEYEFFAYTARAMRHLLIDLARRKSAQKAGGDAIRVDLEDVPQGDVSVDPAQALILDEALSALQADSPRAAQVLELHFFGGLPLERVAALTQTSTRTVDRDWKYAKAFLGARMKP